jgi:serine/threonine-protein kinase HipA
MNKKCLYCYKPLDESAVAEYHERCSLQFFGNKIAPKLGYTLGQMTELAKDILERSVAVPGVQPKLSLSLINDGLADNKKGRLTVMGALGGNYIFKPPSEFYPEMPQNEHLTMRMAEEVFGLKTVPSSLIRLDSGELSYITKRIDRTDDGQKIHMIDMFQILEAFDKYISSMERIGKAIGLYSTNTFLDKISFFELIIFSFLTGNSDMHLKNFSMINDNGHWGLAPAYDLLNVAIANPEDKEELALTIEGKKRKLKAEHFERFGAGMELTNKQIRNALLRFFKGKDEAFNWIDNSFLSETYKSLYKSLMEERYHTLGYTDYAGQ